MKTSDFNTTLSVDQNPEAVFNAINDIQGWWSQDFRGASRNVNDIFEVRFKDIHYSQQKLIEVVPNKKVVWLVTDSKLTFLKDESEWTGTKVDFDISEQDGKTQIHFTHFGLVPEIECFKDCQKGWTYYLDSLQRYITTGQGQPNLKES